MFNRCAVQPVRRLSVPHAPLTLVLLEGLIERLSGCFRPPGGGPSASTYTCTSIGASTDMPKPWVIPQGRLTRHFA